MNLKTKKILAAKTLGVGKNRIYFDPERLSEIKDAITKQDIIALNQEGLIKIKPVKGRKKIEKRKRKRKRGPGKIKMKIKKRKQNYVKLTRKLRRYIKGLKQKGVIDRELYWEIRKKIKTKTFKSLSNLKEFLSTIKNSSPKSFEKKNFKDTKSSKKLFHSSKHVKNKKKK
ncbi:MAG: 50S ribosomal protein L19e [Candidatus Pacearchaeota archaeon]